MFATVQTLVAVVRKMSVWLLAGRAGRQFRRSLYELLRYRRVFHSFTHAFFKALLFLGAGSVIHAGRHSYNMSEMGGLRKTCRSRSGPS